MTIEAATDFSTLDDTLPLAGDPLDEGDDHIRLLKSVIKTIFPGAGGLGFNTPITANESEINVLAGVVPGTRKASSALVVDAAGTIDALDITNLSIGGTAFSGTAAELNNVAAITSTAAEVDGICKGKTLASAGAVIDNFPTGTIMTFQQTSAPTGWTKITTHNDKAFRVVSGTASSGGTNAFSTVMTQTTTASHALTVAELPSHNHAIGLYNNSGSGNGVSGLIGSAGYSGTSVTTNANGSGSGHTHGITMDIEYVDLILASKN